MTALARQNGRSAELHILGCSTCQIIDGDLGGIAVEVKSAQVQVRNGKGRHHTGTTTSGRFILTNYQHRALLEKRGDYIFAVMNEGQVIAQKRIPAFQIEKRFQVSSRRQTAISHPRIIKPPFHK